MNTHKFQLGLILAGLAAACAILIALATLEASARDAREAIHDGQTPEHLCGDICRDPDPAESYAPRVIDPAEACTDEPAPILGDDC